MNPRTLTSAWLREYRPPNGVLPIGVEVAAMLADALDIADSAARADIELYCVAVTRGDETWWNWENLDPVDGAPYIEQAVRYLEARGLLERDGENANVVRIVDEAEVAE